MRKTIDCNLEDVTIYIYQYYHHFTSIWLEKAC